MSQPETATTSVEVRIALEEGRPTSAGEVHTRPLRHPERVLRGIKWLILFWALAAAFIPIPILHFILVPSFLIAGPLVAWKRAAATAVIEAGQVRCARCAQPVPIEERLYGWPAELFCKACGVSLLIAPPRAA